MPTVNHTLTTAKQTLSHLEDSSIIAEALLTHTLNLPSTHLWSHPDHSLTPAQITTYQSYIHRAANHEPLAYILGYREFYGRRFQVTPDTLIPRPESEQLIHLALDYLAQHPTNTPTIVDVGTGTGCLSITLALEIPQAQVYAIDISPAALEVAQRNAQHHQATNITFLQGSLLAPLRDITSQLSIDIILANLPYISDSEYNNLPQNVRLYEPKLALVSGPTPDKLNNQLVIQAKDHLKSDGFIAYETTNGQIIIPDIKTNNNKTE